MRMQDIYKLIYQSEFAGGHLITDSAQSEKRIEEERRAALCRAGAPPFASPERAFEDIGGELCRLHLHSPDALNLGSATINRFFVNTALTVKGDTARFEKKLGVLLDCCREGVLPFGADEAESYIASQKKQGYPPVSHSEPYRAAYAPAYRVVCTRYRDFAEVFCRIDALITCIRPIVVAIDGGSAAGKSSLAELIGGVYDANIFHMDDFFLPEERKTPKRLSQPGGNVDYERFAAEVMAGIKRGGAFEYRPYSCKTGLRGAPVRVQPKLLSIVEGAYSLHPELEARYDLKIFFDIDPREQSRRILERNGEAMHRRFMQEWIPLEQKYASALDIPGRCELVYRVPLAAEKSELVV
jgi:hypothetical protein